MCLIILQGSHGLFYRRQESVKRVGLPRMWLRGGGRPAEDETVGKTTSHLPYRYCLTQHCFQSCLQCEPKKGSSKKHLFGIQLTKLSTAWYVLGKQLRRVQERVTSISA